MYDLTQTQTQEESESFPEIDVNSSRPWGRLSSCVENLPSVDLFSKSYLMGRSPECHIIVGDKRIPCLINISKVQFEITKTDDDLVYVKDLSKNGTLINNRKIRKNETYILNNDDFIAIGQTNYKIYRFNLNVRQNNEFPMEMTDNYYIAHEIGRGAFGEIRLAHSRSTFEKFAIKRIKRRCTNDSFECTPPNIKTEIEILTRLSSPFIMKMIEVFENEDEVFLILEYMPDGELTSLIVASIPIPEDHIKFIFYQIMLALQFLHKNRVTHRDLKPENILLVAKRPLPIVKVSDFGLSKIMSNNGSFMETVCGTVCYTAPEVIRGDEGYTNKVDIWSLGVILYYMLTRRLPFRGSHRSVIIKSILTGRTNWDNALWKNQTPQSQSLTRQMLTVDVDTRIETPAVFRSEWLNDDSLVRERIEKLLEDSDEPPTKRFKSH